MLDANATIEHLKKLPGVFEAYHVSMFTCYREAEDGSDEEITVEVLDAGEGAGPSRYSAIARPEDGGVAHGDPAQTVEEALSNVRWAELE